MSKAILSRVATRIFNTPLFIHPAKLDVILSVVGDRFGLDTAGPAISAEDLAAMEAPKKETIQMKVGSASASSGQGKVTLSVIPVFGTLVHRVSGLGAWSGMRSYESIRADFQKALIDQETDGIVFELASNGGEGHGLFDLVDEIYQARENNTKRITAIVNEYAYSAGYALASACHDVYLTRTSGVGSIGVIARHADISAKNEKDGVKYTTMFEGDRKNDFSQDGPLSTEAQTFLRKSLQENYKLFVDTVARNRGLEQKAVRETQAAIYEGKEAVSAGLADAVLSFNEAVKKTASNIKPTGGRVMSGTPQKLGLQHQLEALFKGSSETEIAAALSPLGYMPSAEHVSEEAKKEHGNGRYEDGKKETMAYVNEIQSLCALAGKTEMAADILDSELSIELAKKQLIDAAASSSETISSTVAATSSGQQSSLVANAQARADRAQ